MTIGKRISQLRKEKGLNQQQLADDLGVSTSSVAMWETDKRAIKDDTIVVLANYFNVSSDYILGLSSSSQINKKKNYDQPTTHSTIAAHIDDDVTDDQMKDIMRYIELLKLENKAKQNK